MLSGFHGSLGTFNVIFFLFVYIVQSAQIAQLFIGQGGNFLFCTITKKLSNEIIAEIANRRITEPSSWRNFSTSSSLRKLNRLSGLVAGWTVCSISFSKKRFLALNVIRSGLGLTGPAAVAGVVGCAS
jgi:hypothetical protein